ncbi:MAG: transporter substrate-binding domain-containing protein [Clostridium sp.]|nr:transporter substrate-binding domain-containing protein [Clostridium sp.]MCM1459597.1 transporter substrate-binding domain-containing protein [Bacteroides sp.]
MKMQKLKKRKIKKNIHAKIICVLFALCMAVCSFPSLTVNAETKGDETDTEGKVVRVGYYHDNAGQAGGYNERKQGYAYEYYQEIAKYTGWIYEYEYGTWDEIYQKLLSGEVDIMAMVTKDAGREKSLLFSEYAMGGETYYIYVPDDSAIDMADGPSALNGKRIGVKSNTYMARFVEEFAEENNITCEAIPYDELEERKQAIENGELDCIVTIENDRMEGYRKLFNIGTYDYYFAVNKNRKDILQELNVAQREISSDFPFYVSRLEDKYYNRGTVQRDLNAEEKAWLGEHGEIRVGYLNEYMPFCDQDENSGELLGILPELLENLSDYMGITFTSTCYDEYDAMIQALKAGELDMIFPTFGDLWYSETQGYIQTISIVSTHMSVVYQGDYSKDIYDSAAVYNGSPQQSFYLSVNYPDTRQKMYQSWEDCLLAIQKGDVDCMLVNSDVIHRYMNAHDEFANLHVAEMEEVMEFCFAVNRGSSTLYAILNKGINNIDDALIRDSLVRNSYVEGKYTVQDFLTDHIVLVLVLATGFILLLILFFVMYRIRVKRDWEMLQKSYDREKMAQVALREAYEAASSANQAKSNFLSRMSHDIRTPMNAIIGMTSIASAHIDDKKRVKDCLDKITSSGKHLLTLINEVLDMSKIESGKMEFAEEEFSLQELIDNMLNIVQPQIEAKNHEMKVYIKDIQHDDVIGDSLHIEQVFLNIMGNAIKYTPSGGKINLYVTEKITNQSSVGCYEFIFEDNGIGMSKDFLEHVFDPFSRENDTKTNKIQGTGLGLSIVLNIVRMMGGDIRVESEQGKGSKFIVTIYLQLQDDHTISFKEYVKAPVLVVDDSKDACESTCMILDEMGIESEWVLSGQAAVEKVKEAHDAGKHYFAAILDWKMPEMDGVEAVGAIREIVGEDTAIIIQSAYDWSEIEEKAKQAGVSGFISKPVFKSRLSYLFRRLVNGDGEGSNYKEIVGEARFDGKRILLVEDNEINAEIAKEILESMGLEVKHVWDGQEAVTELTETEQGHYDLVFMDIQMPVMDGYEASRQIRAKEDREDLKNIPIIALTANAFAEDVRFAMRAGMNHHIAKPLDIKQVIATLNKWLNV